MAVMVIAGKHPYHHGDLRNALVQAGVELAREGGNGAIVLREAARRVGVSQTAAYRHFAALPDLANAVSEVAQTDLATLMRHELARVEVTEDVTLNALGNLHAVGRGYILFALAEPGLFSTAFINPKERPRLAAEDPDPSANELFERSLDGLVQAGLLDPANRAAATATAWAGVHGLSLLLLGPMSAVPPDQLSDFIDSCLELLAFGLVTRG